MPNLQSNQPTRLHFIDEKTARKNKISIKNKMK